MLKNLIVRGIEKVAIVTGFNAGRLREDLAKTCEQVVGDRHYNLRLRTENGRLLTRILVDGYNHEVKVPDDFDTTIETLLEKHISRKRYRLILALKDGEFDTIRVHSDSMRDSTIDFGSDDVNRAYGRFRETFFQLQEAVWDGFSSGESDDMAIVSTHLERIEEIIEEVEAVIA